MKQQQMQVQGASSPAVTPPDIEAIAMRNFEARNIRRDRAWSRAQGDHCPPALPHSERERLEFIEYARHQFEMQAGRSRSHSGPRHSQTMF